MPGPSARSGMTIGRWSRWAVGLALAAATIGLAVVPSRGQEAGPVAVDREPATNRGPFPGPPDPFPGPPDPIPDDDRVGPVERAQQALRSRFQVVGEVVARAVAFARGPGDDDPELAEWRDQYANQFRPRLQAELNLLRVLGPCSHDQKAVLAKDGEAAVKAAADQYARQQWNQVHGVAAVRPLPPPEAMLREAIAAALERHLSAELAARYRAEIAERIENRRRVALENVLVRLDRDLALGDDRLARLRDALARHWDDDWCSTVEYAAQFGQDVVPAIPDPLVAPLLSADQKTIWEGLPKQGGIQFGGLFEGMIFDLMEEEVVGFEVDAVQVQVDLPGIDPGDAEP